MGRPPAFVHGPGFAEAVIPRRSGDGGVRRSVANPWCLEARPEHVRRPISNTSDHTTVTKPALRPTAPRACWRLLADARRTGSGRSDRRPVHGLAVSGRSHSAGSNQFPRPPRAWLLSVAERRRHRWIQPSDAAAHGDGTGRRSNAFRSTTLKRNQLYGNFAYQRVATAATNAFGFADANDVSASRRGRELVPPGVAILVISNPLSCSFAPQPM